MFHAYDDAFSGGGIFGRPPVLEVIERRAKKARQQTPVLFIHGAYSGAWCWAERFMPYFAERGIDTYALSLRGHGKSGGQTWLHSASMSDYVDDVARVVHSLPNPPVLIGHSMGGMVVQKYLEKGAVLPGAVLLASVPPSGLTMSSLRLMVGDPWLLAQLAIMQAFNNPRLTDFKITRRALFSDDVPDEDLERYIDLFQSESTRALWDMSLGNLPRAPRGKVPPMLVMGGGNDALFTREMVETTGRVYGVKAEIVPGCAHAMMLDKPWEQAAARIVEWLGYNVP